MELPCWLCSSLGGLSCRCLRTWFNVGWIHRVSNVQIKNWVLSSGPGRFLSQSIKLNRFRWLGRVLHMAHARLPYHAPFRSSHGVKKATRRSTNDETNWNKKMYSNCDSFPWLESKKPCSRFAGGTEGYTSEMWTVAVVLLFCRIRITGVCAFVWSNLIACVGYHGVLFFSRPMRVCSLSTLGIHFSYGFL